LKKTAETRSSGTDRQIIALFGGIAGTLNLATSEF